MRRCEVSDALAARAEYEALTPPEPKVGPIAEGHWLWPLVQDGRACQYGTRGCSPEKRLCRYCGGCCLWVTTPHWTEAEQARLTPGVRVAFRGHELTVTGRDHDPLGYERITLSGDPTRRWWLEFEACGAAHYEFQGDWNKVGGGSGGADGLAIVEMQAALL